MSRHMDKFIIRIVFSKTVSKSRLQSCLLTQLYQMSCTRLLKKNGHGSRGRKLSFYHCWITFWANFPKTQWWWHETTFKTHFENFIPSARFVQTMLLFFYRNKTTTLTYYCSIRRFTIYQTLLWLKKSNTSKVFTHLMHNVVLWQSVRDRVVKNR